MVAIQKKNCYVKQPKEKHLIRVQEKQLNHESIETIQLSGNEIPFYEIIFKELLLFLWIEKLKKISVFAFGIDTDGKNNISANLVGLSFSIEPGVAAYVPVNHSYHLPATDQISRLRILELLKPLLEDKKLLKIGQNLKFFHSVLQNYGIELRGITFDTMLESYILESFLKHHDMNSLSARWLKKHRSIVLNPINNETRNLLVFGQQVTFSKKKCYAAEDTDITLRLHLKMWPKIQQHKGLTNIFKHIEMPLVPVLSRMERNGVKINPTVLHEYSEEIALRLSEIEQKAYNIVGEHFNLSSTKQLQIILFKKNGIKSLKKTPGGEPSTSEDVLELLAINCPLAKLILEYRGLAKLKSNYTDKLPLMINNKTGRVHTSYHLAVAITGRLSSTNPNLQNIPARNTEGRRIRQSFISSEDYVIVSADYSQIELRIMAHLSRDKGLLTTFTNDKDIHCITAADIFSLSPDSVTNEYRRSAKVINFGLIYGMSAFGLSRRLNISRKKSQQYIDLYFDRYPGVWEYMERIRFQARLKGYVETIQGRRLYLPDIKSTNATQRARAERTAISAPIQGSAADLIKRAMIAVDTCLEKRQLRALMIMQVHDELVFEVHKDDVEIISKKLRKVMENIMTLEVLLPVDIGVGENWALAH